MGRPKTATAVAVAIAVRSSPSKSTYTVAQAPAAGTNRAAAPMTYLGSNTSAADKACPAKTTECPCCFLGYRVHSQHDTTDHYKDRNPLIKISGKVLVELRVLPQRHHHRAQSQPHQHLRQLLAAFFPQQCVPSPHDGIPPCGVTCSTKLSSKLKSITSTTCPPPVDLRFGLVSVVENRQQPLAALTLHSAQPGHPSEIHRVLGPHQHPFNLLPHRVQLAADQQLALFDNGDLVGHPLDLVHQMRRENTVRLPR